MKIRLLCLLPLYCGLSYADVTSAYPGYAAYANSLSGLTQRSIAKNPDTNLPGFTNNPSETSYYGNSNSIAGDSASALNQNTAEASAGNASNQNLESGPQVSIDPNSPTMSQPLLAQSDAYDISHGISDQYVNCNNQTQCHIEYTNQTCQVERQLNLTCMNTLEASVSYQPYQFDCNHIVINGNFEYSEAPGPANGMCVTGFYTANLGISTSSPYSTSGTVNAVLPPNVQGQVFMLLRGLDGQSDFNYGADHFALSLSSTELPNFAIVNPAIVPNTDGNVLSNQLSQNFSTPNTGQLVNVSYNYNLEAIGAEVSDGHFHFQYYFNPIVDIQPAVIYISYPETEFNVPTPMTTWVNSCQNDSFLSQCTQTSSQCTEAGGTQIINGTPITEPCWQYTLQYQCGSNSNSCGSSINGCDETGSTCATPNTQGLCLNYNVTYQCAQNVCAPSGAMCGKPTFCLNGNCAPSTPSQSSDFGQDDAEMEAAADAANAFAGGNNVQAFVGAAMDCAETIAGMYNCCAKSGWGISIGLAHCNAQEQQLGQDRENGVAYFVGRYCYKKVLGVCTDYHEMYCDWGHGETNSSANLNGLVSDTLAYDVQVQGRLGQLGISFGTGDNPNCSGLTVQQITGNPPTTPGINFNAINFSNISNLVEEQASFPNSSQTQQNIENQLNNGGIN